ncbi:unnamed protein product [Paramecium octaurelia]|uniref:Uncharacterized protein n=1 Tax=Paramecium octaurelia TaxID=43137 RepID=A0A8S1XDZ3_PAROT|nr:unnamed protein product [Paramecium octaurelia]
MWRFQSQQRYGSTNWLTLQNNQTQNSLEQSKERQCNLTQIPFAAKDKNIMRKSPVHQTLRSFKNKLPTNSIRSLKLKRTKGWLEQVECYNLNQEAALKCNDFQTWYNYDVRYNLRKRQAIKKIRVTIPQQAKGKQTIEEQLMKSAILFNQPNLKKAFQNIKRMATLNPSKKKEAGIFRGFKDDQDNIHIHSDTEQNFAEKCISDSYTLYRRDSKAIKNSYQRNLIQVVQFVANMKMLEKKKMKYYDY